VNRNPVINATSSPTGGSAVVTSARKEAELDEMWSFVQSKQQGGYGKQ